MQKKKRLLKRRKKKAVRRRKHYLDEASLQPASSAVYLVRRIDSGGVNSEGLGNERLFIMAKDKKLSDVIWTIHRTLGNAARFTIEQIISGEFYVKPTAVFCYFNRDGRIFNQSMEIVKKGDR